MEVKNEVITNKEGKEISIDPNLLLDTIDDINQMVNGHTAILRGVKSIIDKYVAGGMSHDDAAAVALEFQRRAGKKANEMFGHGEDAAKKVREAKENAEETRTEVEANPKDD